MLIASQQRCNTLGSVYCSVISFLAWHGVGGARHCSMVQVQDQLPAFWNGNALVSVDQLEISEVDVQSSLMSSVVLFFAWASTLASSHSIE